VRPPVDVLAHRPRFDAAAAARIAREVFAIDGEATPLPSERDQNFRLDARTGACFVLKIANATDERALLEAQQEALARVAASCDVCPRVTAAADGETLAEVSDAAGGRHLAWLVGYMEGVPLATVRRHTTALMADLGRRLAQIDRALAGWDAPALRREFPWDLARAGQVVEAYAPLVSDQVLRDPVRRVAGAALGRLAALASSLRRSIVHNDANDHNVLVGGGDDLYTRRQRVTGVLDFGDMIESYRAADPAVAMAYAMLDKVDPLATAAALVGGYHHESPLDEPELAALFDLACLRLCVSVCMAAHQQRQQPGDAYLSISQEAIARTLPRLARVPAGLAEATFRHACGLPAVASGPAVVAWLESKRGTFAPVLGVDLQREPSVVFDLGVSSPLVEGDPARNGERDLTERLCAAMGRAGAWIGVGRYDEARLLYDSPAFAVDGLPGERRTIHLGLDLFAPPGTPVHAPLDGVVHFVGVNDAPQDYGGLVILRHEAQGLGPGAWGLGVPGSWFQVSGPLSPARACQPGS